MGLRREEKLDPDNPNRRRHSNFLVNAVLLNGLKGCQTSIEILSPKVRIDVESHNSLDLSDPCLEVYMLAPGL